MNSTQRLFAIGCMLFIWYACMVIIPQITLLLKVPFGAIQCIFSNLAFVFIWVLLQRSFFSLQKPLEKFFVYLAFASILIASLWYSQSILDSSFDGNWYHLDAIYLLKQGWNPVYHSLQASQTSFSHHYLQHFPKGSWLFGANLLAISDEAELGKASTLILSVSLLCITPEILKKLVSIKQMSAYILAVLMASNPILLLNFGNFYADGQLGALLCIGSLFILYQIKEGGWLFSTLGLLAFALLANTKYNGTAYAFLFTGSFLLYLLLTQAYKIKKIILIGSAWLLFTFVVLGFNPFITNFIEKGHPFYPLNTGTESVFNVAHNYPANFISMNRFEKFFASLYAQPDWAIQPKLSTLKKLFRPISFESYSFGNANLAGFGPVLPEILLLILPLGLALIILKEPKHKLKYGLCIVLIMGSIFLNPESWVMRYVPQFWLIPILMLLVMLKHKRTYALGMIASLILIGGNAVLGYHYLKKCHVHTKELINQVELVKHSHGEFLFDAGWSKPFQYRIEKLGLNLQQQTKLNPEDSLVKPFTGGLGAHFKKRNNN